MHRALSALLLFVLSATNVAGQQDRAAVSTLDAGDRYLIGAGTMISASVPSARRNLRTLGSRGRELLGDLSEAVSIIQANHVDGLRSGDAKLISGAIDGMLSSLDPHSDFLDRSEFDDLLDEQHAEYSGIGATIATYRVGGRNQTFVLGTFDESPARRAGLRFGDRIMDIDGRSAEGLDTDEVRALVRGRTGSAVTIRVARLSGESVVLRLRRMTLQQKSIPTSYQIRPGIGYIDATEGFTETTDLEIRRAVEALKREGMRSLILDLRNNPGGLLNQAVKVSELFLPAGKVILTQRGRGSDDNRQWVSRNLKPETLPLIVLVNSSTASAAEIVAGALQDHDRAVIIGETTFGKGLVQTVIGLDDGSGLTLTTGRYFTPSGRSVQRNYQGLDTYTYLTRQPFPVSTGDFSVSRTDSGRTLIGGNGIMPEIAMSDRFSEMLGSNPPSTAFFRAVEVLKAHLIAGPEKHSLLGAGINWNVTRLTQMRQVTGWTECIPARYLSSSTDELELRHLLAMADVGSTAARQVIIESDPIVLRAIEEFRGASASHRAASGRK